MVAEMDSFTSVHKRPDENVCSEIDTRKTYYNPTSSPLALPRPPHSLFSIYPVQTYWKQTGTETGFLICKRRFFIEYFVTPALISYIANSYLLPDTSKRTKRKTSVIKRNLNPIWNHSFAYDNLTIDELRNRVLELTVWDYDRGSSNDFLGGLRLGLGNNTEPWDDSQGLEIEAWRLMLERPNKWLEHTLNLRSSMDSQVD